MQSFDQAGGRQFLLISDMYAESVTIYSPAYDRCNAVTSNNGWCRATLRFHGQEAKPGEKSEPTKKRRPFKKFFYRGVDLDQLLDMNMDQIGELMPARIRRRLKRGLRNKHKTLLKKLRKSKKECPFGEKPAVLNKSLSVFPGWIPIERSPLVWDANIRIGTVDGTNSKSFREGLGRYGR
ncbi:ribosomal protein S15 [Clonorchis sinensis]|uniref:40S ribosomal protein S15 n=1 Tax=Clonorchis sinensis TaxID=79923 RepID=A0A419PCQ4_CLOSI|nr:ribosomal protein S15 [Clonorchis sinensis]